VSIPFGTRSLFIRCSDDKQFGGILKLFQEMKRSPASYLFEWQGVPTDLSRRRVLRRVLISGHGNPIQAGFELDSERGLKPEDLRLPACTGLYLMGCHQGREKQRLAWAAGTGVEAGRVRGCAGETESALSTCLLLHLLEEGAETIDHWFPMWRHCNNAFRPYFPMIREAYARKGADPLAALEQLKGTGTLDALFREFEQFLAVITRKPAYLSDLM
jgi:hypothetical protein